MIKYFRVLILSIATACAQDMSLIPLQVVRQADEATVVNLQNNTASRIVAYLILSKELTISKMDALTKTIRTESGAFRDAAIEHFVTAIAPGETKEVLRFPARDRTGIEHRSEYELAAVLFDGGKAAGKEPWVAELRERRELTNRTAKGVLAILRQSGIGLLTLPEASEHLRRLKTDLQASAVSDGGKRLCEAFIGDVLAQFQAVAAEPDVAKRAKALDRTLSALTRAQEYRLNRFREWGVE